jgi:outer membrane biosynthesis protein TonB
MSECSRLLWSNVYLFSDSVTSLDRQKNMNEVNRFLEEGILQAIRNLLPVKSILRESLQEEDDDAIQISNQEETDKEAPPVQANEVQTEVSEPVKNLPEPVAEPVVEAVDEPIVKAVVEPVVEPVVEEVKAPETLVIDTERSVGFTGIDSVFGTNGEAELRASSEETDELKIIGDLEELDIGEIEDLDKPQSMSTPLAVDDYETL